VRRRGPRQPQRGHQVASPQNVRIFGPKFDQCILVKFSADFPRFPRAPLHAEYWFDQPSRGSCYQFPVPSTVIFDQPSGLNSYFGVKMENEHFYDRAGDSTSAASARSPGPAPREKLLHRNLQRFRDGLVFKAHRICVSLNSRLESNNEGEEYTPLHEGLSSLMVASCRPGGMRRRSGMRGRANLEHIFKAHGLLYHSTLGLRVLQQKKELGKHTPVTTHDSWHDLAIYSPPIGPKEFPTVGSCGS